MLGRALLVSGEAESPARCTRTESVQPKVSKSLKAAGSGLDTRESTGATYGSARKVLCAAALLL